MCDSLSLQPAKKVLIKHSDLSNCWLYKWSDTSPHTIDILRDDVCPFLEHHGEVDAGNADVLTLQVLLLLGWVTDHCEANTEKGKNRQNRHRGRKSPPGNTIPGQVSITKGAVWTFPLIPMKRKFP